ncbi:MULTISPECIES: hypothetical protein [Bacteroides]|uniref:Uncharacterized protein n=1 Tax=Bacteroides fragilis TaxID=817 RepID=A0A9Q4JEP4_BACFG|nr:hypothetical protein [Bacteroides fragilis]MCZ2687189.1 hypothetical protein [Bacteroides fragilis]
MNSKPDENEYETIFTNIPLLFSACRLYGRGGAGGSVRERTDNVAPRRDGSQYPALRPGWRWRSARQPGGYGCGGAAGRKRGERIAGVLLRQYPAGRDGILRRGDGNAEFFRGIDPGACLPLYGGSGGQ